MNLNTLNRLVVRLLKAPPTAGHTRYFVTLFRNGEFVEEEVVASYYELNRQGDLHFYYDYQPRPLTTFRRECWESVREADAQDEDDNEG